MEDVPIRLVSYIDFKEWLEKAYPIFEEVETDVWQYKEGNIVLSVKLQTYDKYNDDGTNNYDQFVGVGYDKGTSGGHISCDTFEEVRNVIDDLYAKFLRVDLHPTYEELGHCFWDRQPSKCTIEKRIGGFDVRCKGCPKKNYQQLSLF